MAKKLKIKEQIAIISSNIDSIGCAIERKSREDRELEREKLELEREKLNWGMRTKDRVEISLDEYNRTKKRLEVLDEQNKRYKDTLTKMGIEQWGDYIEYDSIKVEVMNDPARMREKVKIVFDCDYSTHPFKKFLM